MLDQIEAAVTNAKWLRRAGLLPGSFAVALVALVLGMLATGADAGSDFKWEPMTDADWAVKEDQARGIRDAVVIFEKTVEDDEEMLSKRCYYSVYSRIRILSAEGRQRGDVVLPYVRKQHEIKEIRGRTVNRDGKVFPLEESKVYDKETVSSEGAKLKRKAFSLPAVSEDCIVEYYYRYQLKEPVNLWTAQEDVHVLRTEFVWKCCTGKGLVGLEYRAFPKKSAPEYIILNATEQMKVEKMPSPEEPKEIRFSATDVPAFEDEVFSPPSNSLRWQVHHYYAKQESVGAFWDNWCKDYFENLDRWTLWDPKTADLAKQYSHMSDPESKINSVYVWISKNVRNLYLDESDPEDELEPNYCVDYVVDHRYGQPIELCVAFWHMLRELDLDARIGFTLDRNEDFFLPEARYSQFYRPLVAVRGEKGDFTFYRPGYDFLAPGELPWYNQGTTAMLVGDSTHQFVTIPYSSAGSNTTVRESDLAMDEELRLSGTITERYKGQPGITERRKLRKLEPTELTETLKQDLSDRFPGLEADSIVVKALDNSREPISVEYMVAGDFAGQQMGDRLLLKPYDFFSRTDNLFTAAARKHDIILPFASETSENLKITVPAGWTVEVVPKDTAFTNPTGSCAISYKIQDGSVSILSRFQIARPDWKAVAYGDLRQLHEMKQAFSEQAVVVRRGSSTTE